MQYFPDMADSPAFKTQGNYIDPPEGSISRTAILYPDTVEEAEKVLKNPFRGTPNEGEHLANGQHLFETYCAICHGPNGDGSGNISDVFPRPPDLRADLYKTKQDGFYFYRMTFGSSVMPSYGDKITASERWDINLYITHLQNTPPVDTATPSSNNGEKK
jgi:mono/diheme cytochrome c family protein